MKKWNHIGEARTPDGNLMTFCERDGTYSIRIDGAELMSTRRHASEDRIAELACTPLKQKRGARILIGGLGLGYTLKAALEIMAKDARVIVAELMPAVIEWNSNPAFGLASRAMKDRRVKILLRDVRELIAEASSSFDAIILDVDNGPASLCMKANRRLYQLAGLEQVWRAMIPGGSLIVWSAAEAPGFVKLMNKAGFASEMQRSRSHTTSGGWHTIFVGKKPFAKPDRKR